MTMSFKRFIVLFASLHCALVSAKCLGGDATCHAAAGATSWCKRDSNTCQGRPDVKCHCESAKAVPIPTTRAPKVSTTLVARSSSDLNHEICIREVGPHSWCRENKTCKDGPHIVCGGSDAAARSVPAAQPAPRAVIAECSPHAVCVALDPTSWCKEDNTCRGFPQVRCGCPDNATAPRPASPTRAAMPEAVLPPRAALPEAVLPPRAALRAVPAPRAHREGRSIVLWAEWPTLEIGQWPEYFGKLLGFIESNCGNFQVTEIVMRILDPEFQSERGQLWQVSVESSFYADFMRHLPANIVVHFYPYLLERTSASRWSRAMRVHVPLEATFKFVRDWNDLLSANGAQTRVAGVVTDKEEGRHFLSDMQHLNVYKERYSSPGQPKLRFGLTLGFDSVGSISGLPAEVDDFYVEMYDFYVHGIAPAVPVEAHNNGALNNPDRFLNILDERVWTPFLRKYSEHDKIVFMWSLQHRESDECMYPLPDSTCGERVDMGSWRADAFNLFLDKVAQRHPVFAHRRHGLFQFSYVPNAWQTCAA